MLDLPSVPATADAALGAGVFASIDRLGAATTTPNGREMPHGYPHKRIDISHGISVGQCPACVTG